MWCGLTRCTDRVKGVGLRNMAALCGGSRSFVCRKVGGVHMRQHPEDVSDWARVVDSARQMAAAFGGGVDQLSELLGKRRGVLRNELAPTSADNRAKLGLVDALRLMRIAGDLRLLHAICLEFGHLALPLPEVAHDARSAATVAALAKEFGELMSVYSEVLQDGRVTNVELAQLAQAWGELMVAGQTLMNEVAAKNAALNKAQGIALGV